jgi:hypothetical protein
MKFCWENAKSIVSDVCRVSMKVFIGITIEEKEKR